jgi:hypothetical protein
VTGGHRSLKLRAVEDRPLNARSTSPRIRPRTSLLTGVIFSNVTKARV